MITNLATNLGIEFLAVPIGATLEEFDRSLSSVDGWDSKNGKTSKGGFNGIFRNHLRKIIKTAVSFKLILIKWG